MVVSPDVSHTSPWNRKRHAHWPELTTISRGQRLITVASAEWSKTRSTEDRTCTKGSAQLVNWLAEMLDRNLIMIPEVDEP